MLIRKEISQLREQFSGLMSSEADSEAITVNVRTAEQPDQTCTVLPDDEVFQVIFLIYVLGRVTYAVW